jgi:hypothetical protein
LRSFRSSGGVGFTDGVDRYPAGELAALRSPHPVSHRGEQAQTLEVGVELRLPVGVVILVILAKAPEIG